MTIKDIARLSSCAVGTVSRVLNNSPNVSPEVRRRVLSVITAHNYTPNENARHLKQQGGHGVAIVMQGGPAPFSGDLAGLLRLELRRRGYTVFSAYLDEGEDALLAAQLICQERKPLGMLFLGSRAPRSTAVFNSIHVPCVLVGSGVQDTAPANFSSVCTDDAAAAAYCISYLARRGHRLIGVVGEGSERADGQDACLNGCINGFAACGLPFFPDRQYRSAHPTMADGYAAADRLLRDAPELTALFLSSDVAAVGALRALSDLGKRIPEDVSLMTCGSGEVSQYATPRMTAVIRNDAVLARRSVELLLCQIECNAPPVRETAAFRLLEGESVRSVTPWSEAVVEDSEAVL